MLRNRSRAVTGKQALMADQTSQSSSSSSASSYTKSHQNSFFGSARFKAFSSTTDHSVISPTSVLDSKPFFSLQNPFKPNPNNTPKKKIAIFPENNHKISGPKKPIGLALIEDKNDSKPTKSVIFSAKLRVQIPALESTVDGGGGGGGGGEMGNGLLMTVKEMELC